jgi:hypothetical protein
MVYEHPQARDYLTQQHRNSKNSSMITKIDYIQTFLQGLTPTESTAYSLWRAIKSLKHVKVPSPPLRTSQRTWARSNVEKQLLSPNM